MTYPNKMKTLGIILMLIGGLCIWLSGYLIGKSSCEVKKPVYVEYFKNGDVLLPDYAVPDTLIVLDAVNLNKDIAPIEQGFKDATDGNIAEVMYKYCKIK